MVVRGSGEVLRPLCGPTVWHASMNRSQKDQVSLMLTLSKLVAEALMLGSTAVRLRQLIALTLWQPHLPCPSTTLANPALPGHLSPGAPLISTKALVFVTWASLLQPFWAVTSTLHFCQWHSP